MIIACEHLCVSNILAYSTKAYSRILDQLWLMKKDRTTHSITDDLFMVSLLKIKKKKVQSIIHHHN